MWNRIIAGILLLSFTGMLFPQDYIPGAAGEEDRFTVYLDRADRERTAAGWQALAEAGLGYLSGPAEEEYRRIMNDRFRRWMEERIGQALPEAGLHDYLDAMRRRRRSLLYTENPAGGGILRDGAGDPVINTASPEETEEAFLEGHRSLKEASLSAWEDAARGAVEAELGGGYAAAVQPVIETRRRALNALYEQVFSRLRESFLTELLQDTRSLRKKSEERTAREAGEELFSAIEKELEGVRLTETEGPAGGLVEDPASLERAFGRFEENYRRVFEEGLDAWTRGETRLLNARMQWEGDTLEAYAAGEEGWQELFETLRSRRAAWFEEMSRYYQEGLRSFHRREDEVRLQMRQFQEGLVLRRDEEMARTRGEVDQLVSLVRQARRYETLAGDTVAFLEEMLRSGGEEPGCLEGQIEKWQGLESSQREAAEGAAEMLRGLSEQALSVYGDVPVTGADMEIRRLQLRLEMLSGQIEILRAVAAYAGDDSSTRETEAETLRAYEASAREAEAALEGYNTALSGLEEWEEEIEALRRSYEDARESAAEAAALRAEAEGEYENLCSSILVSDPAVYEEAVERISGQLYSLYLEGTGYTGLVSAFLDESAAEYARSRAEAREGITALLVEGSDDGAASLAGLVASLNRITGFSIDWESPPDPAELELLLARDAGIDPASVDFPVLTAAYGAWFSAPDALKDYHRRRVVYGLEDLSRRQAAEIYRRRTGVFYLNGEADGVDALLRRDASEASAVLLSEWESLETPGVGEYADTADHLRLIGYTGLLEAEIAALEEYIGLESPDEDTPPLVRLLWDTGYFSAPEEAEEHLAVLLRVRSLLNTALTEVSAGAAATSLEYLADDEVREYLSGDRMLMPEGFPAARLFIDPPPEVAGLRLAGFFNDYDEIYSDLSLPFGEEPLLRGSEGMNRFRRDLEEICSLREAAGFISSLPEEPSFLRAAARMYLVSKAETWDTAAEEEALSRESDACSNRIGELKEEITGMEADLQSELDRIAAAGDDEFVQLFDAFMEDHALPEYCDFIDGSLDTFIDGLETRGLIAGALDREVCRAVYLGYTGGDAMRRAAAAAAGRGIEEKQEELAELEEEFQIIRRASGLVSGTAVHSFRIAHEGGDYSFSLPQAVLDALAGAPAAGEDSGYRELAGADLRGAGLMEELIFNRETLTLLEEYDGEELYAERVVPAEEALAEAEEVYIRAMDGLEEALTGLDEALVRMDTLRSGAAGLYARYREALLEQQKAQEIYEYALGGTGDGGISPGEKLDALLAEYGDIEESLDTLQGLREDLRESRNTDEELAVLASEIEGETGRLFLYRRLLEVLDEQTGGYIKRIEEARNRMSGELEDLVYPPAGGTDGVDEWIEGMAERGDSFLRDCMLAFSYEMKGTRWDILSPAEYTDENGETRRLYGIPGEDAALTRLLSETGVPEITDAYVYEHPAKNAWEGVKDSELYSGFRNLMQEDRFKMSLRDLVLQEFREAAYTDALVDVQNQISSKREGAIALGITASGLAALGASLIAAVISIPAGILVLAEAAAVAGFALDTKTKASRQQEIIDDTRNYTLETQKNRQGLLREMGDYLTERSSLRDLEAELAALLGSGAADVESIKTALAVLAGAAGGQVLQGHREHEEETLRLMDELYAAEGGFSDLQGMLNAMTEGQETRLSRLQEAYADRMGEVLPELEGLYGLYEDIMPGGDAEDLMRRLFVSPAWSREGEYERLKALAEGVQTYGSGDLEADRLELLGTSILAGVELAFDNRARLEYEGFRQDLHILQERRDRWESGFSALVDEGRSEWAASMTTALGRHIRWQEEFKAGCREGLARWSGAVDDFTARRDRWARKAAAAWMAGEVPDGMPETGRAPAIEIPRAAGAQVSLLPDSSALDALMSRVRRLAARADDAMPVLRAELPSSRSHAAVQRRVMEYGRLVRETITRETALAAALRLKEQLRDTAGRLEMQVAEANSSVSSGFGSQLLSRGYTLRGGYYLRKVVVDESVAGGVESQEQKIRGYEYFEAPGFVPAVDLSAPALRGLSSGAVKQRIAAAREGLMEYQELLFGPAEEGTGGGADNLAEELTEFYSHASEAWSMALEGGAVDGDTIPAGLFYFHVGFAPDPPAEAGTASEGGYGESGRIYGSFFEQQLLQARGLALMNTPSYDIKLWDDDADNDGIPDTLVAAPSYRDVINIGTSVAAGVLTGGAGALIMNLADDALFTAADIGNGAEAGQALLGLGRTAAASGLGAGVSALGGMASTGLGDLIDSEFSGALAGFLNTSVDLGIDLAGSALRGYGGAALGALGLEGGSFVFNRDSWDQAVDGLGLSMLSRALGTGVTSGLDNRLYGFHGNLGSDQRALNALAGGAAGGLLEYGLTGETTLNVLNLADVTGGAVHTGLLEMHLGGESLFEVGMAGLDVSAGTLADAAGGFEAYRIDREISGIEGSEDNKAALRALASMRHLPGMESLYEDLLSGAAQMRFDGPGDAAAQTIFTDGGRVLHLADAGGSNHDQLLLGVVLAHEASRNGITDSLPAQFEETLEAVVSHSLAAASIAGTYGWGYDPSGALAGEAAGVTAALASGDYRSLAEHVGNNYDFSADYWKLIRHADGTGAIVWDGKRDLTNEAGDLLQADDTGSLSRSLLNYLGEKNAARLLRGRGVRLLGMDDDERAYALMTSSGAFWDEDGRAYRAMNGDGRSGDSLENLLSFETGEDQTVNLGKISQRSGTIAYIADQGGADVNVISKSGCYYISTLAAVQTAAGKNLTAEQINRLTVLGLQRGYLSIDEGGIGTTGVTGREGLARYAFAELGLPLELDFRAGGEDGAILVGMTVNGNNHAREGDDHGRELFDPYSNTAYLPGQEVNEIIRFDVIEQDDQFLYSYLQGLRYETMMEMY